MGFFLHRVGRGPSCIWALRQVVVESFPATLNFFRDENET